MSSHAPNGQPPKSIDERPQALTQSVEILAGKHGDHEERMAKLEQISNDLKTSHEVKGMLNRVIRIEESLAGIALDHDAPIKRLEGQQ